MTQLERVSSRLIGKWLFGHDSFSLDLLILLFMVFVIWTLFLKKKGHFASPPASRIPIFSFISTIFVTVLSAGSGVVNAMDHPPVPPAAPMPPAPAPEGSNSALFTYTSDLADDSASSGRSRNTGSSVNQPLPGEQAMPPAPPVMQETANRAPPYVPYPHPVDEIIGGDSVESIQRRLLGTNFNPSAHDVGMARIQAEDLFEVKVDIIRKMAGLHPRGDWMRWGARALDNPRTATGEEDLARLHQMLDDLQSRNSQSATFWLLVERVRLRADEDTNSAT